jgi:hypothetical protein
MTKFKLIPGVNPACSNDDYHADREYLSSSSLKMIVKDPKAFYDTYILNKEPENQNKAAFALGSYLHAVILEPHTVETDFAVFTGKQRRGKDWISFEEENKNKTIITGSQKGVCDSLIKNYESTILKLGEKDVPVASFFKKGIAEETMCAEIRGVKIKVRTDYRRCDDKYQSITDVKSTGAIISTREQAEEVCAMWDYDLSAALYCDVAEIVTGESHNFYFCFLSKKNGEVKVYKASEEMLQRGRDKYMAGINRIIEARETNVWFTNRVEELR